MPTIDLFIPVALPVSQGGLPYDQRVPPSAEQYNLIVDTFQDVLHGAMDRDNKAAGPLELVQHRHVQKGALAYAWTVGGTAALDYPAYLFSAVADEFAGTYANFDSVSTTGDGPPGQKYAIPGLCKTFILEKETLMLFTWSFETIVDGFGNGVMETDRAVFGLVLDDDAIPSQERLVGPSKEIDAADAFTASDMFGYARSRRWCGHYLQRVPAGEHTIAMYMTAARNIRITRVRGRGLQVLAFPGVK
jgi:hypothetical protein